MSACSSSLYPRRVAGYELPFYLASEDDLERAVCRDLASMSEVELRLEKVAAEQLALATVERRCFVMVPTSAKSMPAHGWALMRLEMVEAELAERRTWLRGDR